MKAAGRKVFVGVRVKADLWRRVKLLALQRVESMSDFVSRALERAVRDGKRAR